MTTVLLILGGGDEDGRHDGDGGGDDGGDGEMFLYPRSQRGIENAGCVSPDDAHGDVASATSRPLPYPPCPDPDFVGDTCPHLRLSGVAIEIST